jgi:hypothetical protein
VPPPNQKIAALEVGEKLFWPRAVYQGTASSRADKLEKSLGFSPCGFLK